jgi:hypothetical protein
LRRRSAWNGSEALEDWQREGRGLAGAGLCDTAKIAPPEHRRDGVELNRRGRHVTFCGEGIEDRRRESKVGKIGQGGDGLSMLGCRHCVRVNAMRESGDDPRD